MHDEACDITVKDWCVVVYDGELYPGEVQSQQGNSYEVSTKAKLGEYWKIPKEVEKIFYMQNKINQKLAVPILISARGSYKFRFPRVMVESHWLTDRLTNAVYQHV